MYDESEPVLELYPFHPCYPGFFGINCHLQCHCHPSCYCSPVEGCSSCDEIQGCHLLYTDFPFCQGILVPNWRNLMTTFGTPEQKWANNRAADKNVFLRCLQRLNFVFRVIILALLVSYKSYAALWQRLLAHFCSGARAKNEPTYDASNSNSKFIAQY